jgi:D-alanyl-D-alanine carboxypeptidase (penicillin-binding protein 5/6)
MDAQTGLLLYAKDPDRRLPPASTTKVMTAILALESGRLDDDVTVSRTAARVQPIKLNLRPGEHALVRDLTYALMLRSANDASVAVAETLGGSIPGFAERMNRRAAAVGARNTNFVNPNGLPAHGHYSTARDLAEIFRYAMSVPGFRTIAATRNSRVTAWQGTRRRSIAVRNSNRLLQSYRVPVIGKTGYTRAAKRCFVGAAETGGRRVVIALLGSTDLWGDARRLLDYGLAPATVYPSDSLQMVRNDPVPKAPPPQIFALRTPQAPSAPSEPSAPSASLAAPPRTEPDANGRYSLVLSPASNTREAAERLRHYVSRRGHEAMVEVVGQAPRQRYKVRIVGLRTRASAMRIRAALEREHLQPTVVPPPG